MATLPKKPSSSDQNARYRVPSLERALNVLEFLAAHRCPCGLSEIARHLGISKNSVFRILVSLHSRGYVDRNEAQKTYNLNGRLLALGYAAIDEASLVERSLDVMRRLRDETRETVLLGTLVDRHGTVLEQVASMEPVKFLINVGHRFPLHTAAPGKAMLAFLPSEERETLIAAMPFTKFNERTITDKEQFRCVLAETAAKGYAIDRGEEVDGLHCIAAPVFDHHNHVFASIWVTAPSFRLPEENFSKVAMLVMDTARIISRRFGCSCP